MFFHHQLSFVLANHILAGIIAAFIAFPVAFLAKKGSRLHVTAGRIFVISFIIICISGYHIDADEIFKIPLINTGLCHFYHYAFCSTSPLYSKVHDRILITVCINTFALYLCISGWRLANQHRLGKITKKSIVFDACFALLELLMVVLFATSEFYNYSVIYQFYSLSALAYYIPVSIIALIPFMDASRDLYFAVTQKRPKRWWRMHMRKMLMAEYGLIVAFVYRCSNVDNKGIIAAVTLFFLLLYVKAMLIKPTSFADSVKQTP